MFLDNSSDTNFKSFSVKKNEVSKIITALKNKGNYIIGGASALKIIKLYRIPVIKNLIIKEEKNIGKVSQEIPPPYVMKIESNDIIHKSDVGGIRLGIEKNQLQENFRDMISKAKKITSNIYRLLYNYKS